MKLMDDRSREEDIKEVTKRYTKFSKASRCRFCRDKIAPDYKNPELLSKLCSIQGKVLPRKRTGNCAKHQRLATNQIKKARFIALLPYITTGMI